MHLGSVVKQIFHAMSQSSRSVTAVVDQPARVNTALVRLLDSVTNSGYLIGCRGTAAHLAENRLMALKDQAGPFTRGQARQMIQYARSIKHDMRHQLLGHEHGQNDSWNVDRRRALANVACTARQLQHFK